MKNQKVKRAFSITFVEYEDGSTCYQFKESGDQWSDFEQAVLLRLVHERLIDKEQEMMFDTLEKFKDIIEQND